VTALLCSIHFKFLIDLQLEDNNKGEGKGKERRENRKDEEQRGK